jgi:hypothetical protein
MNAALTILMTAFAGGGVYVAMRAVADANSRGSDGEAVGAWFLGAAWLVFCGVMAAGGAR